MRALLNLANTQRSHVHRSTQVMVAMALCGSVAAGCGSSESAPAAAPPMFKFPIVATTKTVQGDPLPGIPVLLTLGGEDAETKTIGYTDKDGEFKALINARHDTPVTFGLNAPDDYNYTVHRVKLVGGFCFSLLHLR